MAKRKKRTTKTRRVRASPRRAMKRSRPRRKKNPLSSWVPLSMEDHAYSVVAGASLGTVSQALKPLQEKVFDRAFGQYSDEATLLVASAVGYKLGKGVVKKFAKHMYNGIVFTTGVTAGSGVVQNLFQKNVSSNQAGGSYPV